VCDVLPHRRRLAGISTSTNSTSGQFENRDVFAELTLSLVASDEVHTQAGPETESQEYVSENNSKPAVHLAERFDV
jgi:hypothetical protein